MPKEFQKYFWDTDISKLDTDKHKIYIIERISDHGDLEAFLWLKKTYPVREIKEIATKSRRVGKRTKNFLRLIY